MNRSGWRGLTVQLFVVTVLPLTVLLLAISFGSLALHQQSMRAMVAERDERAARAAAAAISEQLSLRRLGIQALALQGAGDLGPEHALRDGALLLPDFAGGIAFYDRDGSLLATSDPDAAARVAGVAGLLSPPAGAGAAPGWFSNPFADPLGDGLLMAAVAPAGDVLVIGLFAPQSMARRALADIYGDQQLATAYLVAGDGSLLYHTGGVTWDGQTTSQQPGVAAALRGETGYTYLTVAGEEHVVAFSPIAPVGWALVIEEPWRAIADPMLRTTELAPLILIPVLLVAVAGLLFGVRQVVQPLRRLAGQATALGDGNFAALEEPVGGIGEIQRLQGELSDMARRVRRAQQTIRGYLGMLTAAQEEERRRLARDLHDETIQSLIALNQQIQLAEMSVGDEATAARLQTMGHMAAQLIADLRRVIADLRPIYLEDLGLVPALEMLTRDLARGGGIEIAFKAAGESRRLPPDQELALYRIAQEGLSNVLRHAEAAQATVALAYEPQRVTLEIHDDGRGFTPPAQPDSMAAAGHYGLVGIQERAELIGADFRVESAPGAGTTLHIGVGPAPH